MNNPVSTWTPIPIVISCPKCGCQHIDRDEWATRPHRTHRCEYCFKEWRPCNVPTVGVFSLDASVSPPNELVTLRARLDELLRENDHLNALLNPTLLPEGQIVDSLRNLLSDLRVELVKSKTAMEALSSICPWCRENTEAGCKATCTYQTIIKRCDHYRLLKRAVDDNTRCEDPGRTVPSP